MRIYSDSSVSGVIPIAFELKHSMILAMILQFNYLF